MSEELRILKEVASRLNEASIPYMISGSIAMNYYAQPRMTRDIDVVIALGEKDLERFVALFEGEYDVDLATIRNEVVRRGMFNLIHPQLIIKIDFIVLKDGEYDAAEFGRRKQVEIDGTKIWFISPEDLVIYKLFWAKDSMSEMQLKDVRNIIEAAPNLDRNYIFTWVHKLGIEHLLEKATA